MKTWFLIVCCSLGFYSKAWKEKTIFWAMKTRCAFRILTLICSRPVVWENGISLCCLDDARMHESVFVLCYSFFWTRNRSSNDLLLFLENHVGANITKYSSTANCQEGVFYTFRGCWYGDWFEVVSNSTGASTYPRSWCTNCNSWFECLTYNKILP